MYCLVVDCFFTLPVMLLTSKYNFLMYPLHSLTFSLILLILDLVSANLYSFHAIFRADHWCSSLYFLQIFSLFLPLLFNSLTLLLNQGLLLLIVTVLIHSSACSSNSFSIALSIFWAIMLGSSDCSILSLSSLVNLFVSMSLIFLKFMVFLSRFPLGNDNVNSTVLWSDRIGPSLHDVIFKLLKVSVMIRSR